MSIDKNNIDTPEFMDIKFFQDVLRNGFNDPLIQLNTVKFTMGHKPGENYCSLIYRVDVTYSKKNSQPETVSLIIKSQIPDDEAAVKSDFFGKETNMYVYALPKMQDTLQGVQKAPKLYYSTTVPNETIVFQDVTPLGYFLADRVKGLDEEHCSFVLRKLGQYHAASMDLAEKHPEVLQMFNNGMIYENSKDFLEKFFDERITDLAKKAKTWPGFEKMSEKLVNFKNTAFSRCVHANSPQNNEIKVLTYNDLWINNILFKYDNGKVKEVLLIDFQASFYCSPGIDLTHFLYTIPHYHLLETKRDYMIEEYYFKTLKCTLEEIDYTPIPTLQEIFKEIRKREISGFLCAVCKLILICIDKGAYGENNMENNSDPEMEAKIRAIAMSSERYRNTMKYILTRIEKQGGFD